MPLEGKPLPRRVAYRLDKAEALTNEIAQYIEDRKNGDPARTRNAINLARRLVTVLETIRNMEPDQ